jgi:hypothetical protein
LREEKEIAANQAKLNEAQWETAAS